MAQSGNLTNGQYQYNDIQTILSIKLEESRQQFSEYFSKPIHALAAVDDSVEGQFERALQEERRAHTGERIILIPYYLVCPHWGGILIEFSENGQMKRADYINLPADSNGVLNKLQKQLAQVYPDKVLQAKNFQKQDERTDSIVLMIENLLRSANFKLPTTTLTSTAHISPEGNEYELRELEQKSHCDLTKWKVANVSTLPEEIEKSSKQIDECEKKKQSENIKKKKYQWSEIDILKAISSISLSHVYKLKEELSGGLARFNFQNIDDLLREIIKTKERIQKFEDRGRKKKAKQEIEYLQELNGLQDLSDRIDQLTSSTRFSLLDDESKIRQLRQELDDGLKNIKLKDADELLAEIKDTKERIQTFDERKRKEEAQEEREFLRELNELKDLSDGIIKLTSTTKKPFVEQSPLQCPISTDITLLDEQNRKLAYFNVL